MRSIEKLTQTASSTVLLHDWLTGFRGGERVLEAFCEIFPNSPLYTLIYNPGTTSAKIENRKIISSFLNKIPKVEKHYRKLLPIFPVAADILNIREDAQLVFSSSHCVIKGVKKPPGATHISYIHSPMRYLYDQFDSYFGENAPLYQQWGAKACRPYLTSWDIQSNANVDHMIANSYFVQERIKRYYNRDSTVIHPFVDLQDFRSAQKSQIKKQDHYLMVTAFAPNKRVDLAIDAFNELNRPLKIVGSGQQEAWLRSKANKNIEFVGNVSREEVIRLMNEARAFIFPGVEDFGITPLESLASGTPVIAFHAGGVLETLNADTALFFDEASAKALKQAVLDFEKETFNTTTLHAHAESFSKELFIEKISSFISDVVKL